MSVLTTIKDIATSATLIFGAAWTLYIFGIQRLRQPAVRLTVSRTAILDEGSHKDVVLEVVASNLGKTGVAHVLEHMMFKGTKAVPAGEFSKRIAAAGGRDNAFTSKDATGYHEQLHKSQLPLAFELEADRMANLNQ